VQRPRPGKAGGMCDKRPDRSRGGPAHGDAEMEPEAGRINQRSGTGGGKIRGKTGNPAPTTLIIFRAMEIGVERKP
jgi:hypothetical protein